MSRFRNVADTLAGGRREGDAKRAEWDAMLRASREETRASRIARAQFLRDCQAVPVPIRVYAAWLVTWIGQGGKVAYFRDYQYPTKERRPGQVQERQALSFVDANGPHFETVREDYYDDCSTYWMPTRPFGRIPAGYGTCGMNLLILSDLTDGPMNPATNDRRQGWEFGHTTVMTLRLTTGGLCATMNGSYVESYPDVERLIAFVGQEQLVRDFARNLEIMRNTRKLDQLLTPDPDLRQTDN